MSFYKIDWEKFGSWWLPSYLKKPKMLAWVRVMLSPVKALYARLLAFRDFAREQILITNQTLVLQAEVRKLLGEPQVVIINQGNSREKVYTWFLTELLGINPVQYLYTYFLRENSQKKHYRYFLSEQVSEFDFTVYLPDTYLLTEEMKRTLIAFINKYKLPDKRFIILQVPSDQIPIPLGTGVSLPPELNEVLARDVLSYLNFLDTSTIVFASGGTVETVQDISFVALSSKFPVTQENSLQQPSWVDKAGLVASSSAPTMLHFPKDEPLLDITQGENTVSIALLIQMNGEVQGNRHGAGILVGFGNSGEIIVEQVEPGNYQQATVDLELGVIITLDFSNSSIAQNWQSVVIVFKNNPADTYYYVNGQVQNTTLATIQEIIPYLFPYFDPTQGEGSSKEAATASELSIAQMLVLNKEPGAGEVAQVEQFFEEVIQFYELRTI